MDGHGGGACSQVLSARLLEYIAAAILPKTLLEQHLNILNKGSQRMHLLDYSIPHSGYINKELEKLHEESYKKYLERLLEKRETESEITMTNALTTAFTELDADMGNEAINNKRVETFNDTLAVALSGAVGIVGHIDGRHLHVANLGDCAAVIGSISDTGRWIAKKITKDHSCENESETERIQNEHPVKEKTTVIRGDRLLGMLAPYRAFGDYRFKWKKELIEKVMVPSCGKTIIPPNYETPPYLSNIPEVFHYKLLPRDRFMILASDGLWEQLNISQIVRLVGEHLSGKITLTPLKLPRRPLKFKQINEMLLQRKEALKSKPVDHNVATRLIRYSLGAYDYGIEHSRLSQLLSLPDEIVRQFRDDITIIVVTFDNDYLRHCPD